MERIYFIVAVIAFVLSVASLVACIIIFFKMDVINAMRFLQHKPVKKSVKSGWGRPGAAHANSDGQEKKNDSMFSKIRGSDADTIKIKEMTAFGKVGDDGGIDRITAKVSTAAPGLTIVDSESPTDLLEEESERPTGMLSENTESPTDLLEEESERPTGMLEEDSERPTGVLEEKSEGPTGLPEEDSERPTGVLEEKSEAPTGLLEEDSERPTGVLEEGDLRQVSDTAEEGFGTIFKFVITQNEVVVHTKETIV